MKSLLALTLTFATLLAALPASTAPLRPAPPDTSSAVPDSTGGPHGAIRWKPGSHFREGAITGGIIGGVGGAGFLLFIGVLANALNESGQDDVTPLGFVGLGVFGAAIGGSAGALVGAIGSAFPKKPESAAGNPSPEPGIPDPLPGADRGSLESGPQAVAEPSTGPAPRSSFGSITLQPLLLGERFGGGLQLTFLSQLSPAFHVGFEGSLLYSETDIRNAGVVTRIYPAPRTGFYFIGEAGVFDHRFSGFIVGPSAPPIPTTYSVTLFGGGLGMGFESRGERLKFGVEARRRFNLQNINEPGDFGFTQVGVTVRHLW